MFISSQFIVLVRKLSQYWDELDLDQVAESREILISDTHSLIKTHPDTGKRDAIFQYYECYTEYKKLDKEAENEARRDLLPELEDALAGIFELLLVYFPDKEILEEANRVFYSNSPEILTAKYLLYGGLIPPEESFKNLFKSPWCNKVDELKTILKTNSFLDKDGDWKGLTTKKNELSNLYFLFVDKEIFRKYDSVPRIKMFYREFGIIVGEKKEPGIDTVRVNVTRRPNNPEIEDELYRILADWIKS